MNNRLYVGNLAFHTTETALKTAFSQFGDVSEVALVLDRESGRSRGFAFVTMANETDAQTAIEGLNGTDLDGRALRVNVAEARKPRSGGGGFGSDRNNGRGSRARF